MWQLLFTYRYASPCYSPRPRLRRAPIASILGALLIQRDHPFSGANNGALG